MHATMDDWCNVHRITPSQCLGWLSVFESPESSDVPTGQTNLSAAEVWQLCTDAVATALPSNEDAIRVSAANAELNTSPDIKKFPAAYTLHDNGKGQPYVSMPYKGSTRDILTLAHEFGHVIQISNTNSPFTPPALREVCAFMSEGWLIDFLGEFDAGLRDRVLGPWKRSVAADFGIRRDAFLAACNSPQAPYDYAWNYTLARRLALAATDAMEPGMKWQLFSGHLDVPTFANKVGI